MLRQTRRIGIAALALLACAAPGAAAAPEGSTQLVSRPDGIGPVPPAFDNHSDTPAALSADGRYAVFLTTADGFATGTNPAVKSVMLRDTQAGTTTFVSRSDGVLGAAADRDATDPAIAVAPAGVMPDAPAGQPHVLVAFASTAQNLVDHATGLTTSLVEDVWMRDVTAGTTYLVSKADGVSGAPADFSAEDPSIDVGPAGPVIAFHSSSTNLGNRVGGIFLRTFKAADTQLISCKDNDCSGTPDGVTASDPSVRYTPPANGTLCTSAGHPGGCVLVAFDTADQTITRDAGGRSQVAMALSGATATTTEAPTSLFIMSTDSSGTVKGNGDSTDPSFNGDGRAVAFISRATNLTADALPANPQEAYMRSLAGSGTTLLSRADGAAGAAADGTTFSVALGGDAAHLRAAFFSLSTNLGSPSSADVYVRDEVAHTTSLLNRAAGPGGVPGDSGGGDEPVVSADGSSALFLSAAHNLGDGDAQFFRIHVRRLDTGAVELVSRPDGTAAFDSGTASSDLQQGAISDDARYVAFSSRSHALSDADDDRSPQIYVRDTLTNRTILVSRASGGNGAAADASAGGATISGDGRRVAFSSTAGNLTPDSTAGTFQVYVRDLVAQTTTLVSRANGATGGVATRLAAGATISRDGNVVAFVTRSVLDPAGADGRQHAYVRNLAAQTTTLVDRDDGATGAVPASDAFEPMPDADGSRIAWWTQAALAGEPVTGSYLVYRRDLASGRTTLVSRADGAAGAAANFESRAPTIDATGDVIAFQSYASNLGERFPNGQIFVRDVAAGHTQLVSRASGPAGAISSGSVFATIDAAGDRVAFSGVGNLGFAGGNANYETYVRDLPSQTTDLVSRADGAAGATADGDSVFVAINAAGGCVTFSSESSNLGDGFGSLDFSAIHMRALRGDCPIAPPVTTIGDPPGGPRARTTNPPALLSRLAVRPRRFHVGGRRGGTKISFSLDRASGVTLAFDRLVPGHKVKGRCRTRAKRGRRCTITRRVGTLGVSGGAGANVVGFSGRLGRKRLARGSYVLTATPAGGKAQTLRFAVVAAPKPAHKHKRR